MDNLDLTAVARMGLILAHLLAFAAAFAAVAFGDFAIFYRRRVNIELLTKAANGVTLALIALWITGLAVILLDTRLDLALLWGKPKLLAKLSIAGLLTLNGIALHRWAFPLFSQPQHDPHRAAFLPAVLGPSAPRRGCSQHLSASARPWPRRWATAASWPCTRLPWRLASGYP